jgi:Bacterial Ig-like domain (group 1)
MFSVQTVSAQTSTTSGEPSVQLNVLVGYADNLRSIVSFPEPWYGSPGVTNFIGTPCSPPGSDPGCIDSGAILIRNSGSAAVQIDSVVVTLPGNGCGDGGCRQATFNLWGAFTIPPGGIAILTQTSTLNFDTSDYSTTSCNVSNPGAGAPTVAINLHDGQTVVLTDKGHTLDTGTVDHGNCSQNETIFWHDIGATCGSCSRVTTTVISATPSVVFESAGATSSLTATVLDQNGGPISGVTVDFSTSAGLLSRPSAQTDASGEATVTLGPNLSSPSSLIATVSANADGIEGSTEVTFLPPGSPIDNWMQSGDFSIQSVHVNISQMLSPEAEVYNLLAPTLGGQPISITQLDGQIASVYAISPTSQSTDGKTKYAGALSQYFGISSPDGYSPSLVVILDLPIIPTANALLSSNLPPAETLNFPSGISSFFAQGNAHLKLTPDGHLEVAFTLSQNVDNSKLRDDFLSAIASSVETLFVKAEPSDFLGKAGTIITDLNLILDLGDLTVTVITSDLAQVGTLNSYTLLDLVVLKAALSTGFTVSGMAGKTMDMIGYLAEEANVVAGAPVLEFGEVIPAALVTVRLVATTIDLTVELLVPLIPTSACSSLCQDFATGVDVVTTFIDPSGTSIAPSFYDSSGTLALGYDTNSSTFAYASAAGLVIPMGGEYLTLLHENAMSPANYTVTLNALGGSSLVPYNIRLFSYNQTAPVVAYAGMVQGGNSLNVGIQVAKDGLLVEQPKLKPELLVSTFANKLTVKARGLLTNGSAVNVANATLVIGGRSYAMTRVNSSTFDISVATNFSLPAQFLVYMVSPHLAGGIAAGIAEGGSSSIVFSILLAAGGVAALAVGVAVYALRKRKAGLASNTPRDPPTQMPEQGQSAYRTPGHVQW